MNGLVGAKTGGGAGLPKEKRENKRISRAKTGSGESQPKENEKMNGLVGADNRELGRPTLGKD